MVDWDLEAPGLDRYFLHAGELERRKMEVTPPSDKGGLLALLNGAMETPGMRPTPESWKQKIASIKLPRADFPLRANFAPSPGDLDLLPAGQDGREYEKRLSEFAWPMFFERQGGEWLEAIRQQWVMAYDFILIDSRTGLSDAGGVCTIQMPTTLVLVFSANDQSFEGGLRIVEMAQKARRTFGTDRGQLTVVPLLSRWCGDEETDMAEAWMQRFDRDLQSIAASWLPKGLAPRRFLERVRVPHVARFTFGEPLPVLTHSVTDPALPGLAFTYLAELLASNLQAAAEIIDPTIPEPTVSGPTEQSLSPMAVAGNGQEIDIHREIARISRLYGQNSAELAEFMSVAGANLFDAARFTEAEPLLRRSLTLNEALSGPHDPLVASILNNLARLLQATNRFREAEPFIRRALAIDEASYGADHPSVARDLNNLATLLQATNRPTEAEPLMRRALAIDEASYGAEHPEVAVHLNNLASLLQDTNRLREAEPLIRRALAIDEANYGPENPNVARDLNNLAQLLHATNRLGEAEPLMRRALAIDEASYSAVHPRVAIDLDNLAGLMHETNRLEEAESLIRRALAIDEASYGAEHPTVAIRLSNLAGLLHAANRPGEAEPLIRRALAIDEASYGAEHPTVALRLSNLAALLQSMSRPDEAEPLMRRALAIDEASYGAEHPNVARDLNNLATLLKDTNRLGEAEPLMRRALAIDEASYGAEHPNVAIRLNNLARLLLATNRLTEAEPLTRRATVIFLKFQRATGHPHPHRETALANHAILLRAMGRDEASIAAEQQAMHRESGLA